MFCVNCGAVMKEGSAFCEGCGTRREETQAAVTAEPVVPAPPVMAPTPEPPPAPLVTPPVAPPAMAAPPAPAASPQAAYSPGMSAPQAPPPGMSARKKPPSKSKTPAVIVCIVAVLVIAISVGVYFFFFRGEDGLFGGDEESNAGTISGPREIPNAERIKKELSEDGRSIIPSSQTVESVEILEEETNREDWTHFATVLVDSFDEEINYVKYATMSYFRNEDREWILSDIIPERANMWSISPRIGAREDLIESSVRDSLMWQMITIDGEEWYIDESTIESISISNQNTNLNSRKDIVIADVVLGSDAMTARGKIELEFVFNDYWSLSSYSGSAPFTSEYRPNAMMELSNEQLLNEFVRSDATILREMSYNGQSFTVARDEISNFSISDFETSDKGANRLYNFSFMAEKGVITYAVNAQVFYHFDSMSGWIPGDFTTTPEVSSVNLVGTKWLGTYRSGFWLSSYNPQTQLIIEITEVTSDGSVRATLTGFAPEISQTSIGTFDISGLSLKLMFDEWIIEPSENAPRTSSLDRWKDSHKIELTGRLNSDGSTIVRTSGTQFEVSLTDSLPELTPALDDEDDD